MTQVSDGTIYVGTYLDGIKKLVNDRLVDVDSTNVGGGFMTQVSDGTIYVGTDSNGLKNLKMVVLLMLIAQMFVMVSWPKYQTEQFMLGHMIMV